MGAMLGLIFLFFPLSVIAIATLSVLSGNPLSDWEIRMLTIVIGFCLGVSAYELGDVLNKLTKR